MTSKIVKVLVTTVSLAALVLGTAPAWRMVMAVAVVEAVAVVAVTWGGGGHWGGGGARFSGAHFSGARMGMSRFSAAHISGRNFSGRNFSRMSRGNFARVNAAHLHGLGAGALGGRAAWNHGAWNHGIGTTLGTTGATTGGAAGTVMLRRLVVRGPVFWPFFAGDLLAFTFWPWGFYDPFWAYGNQFVWDSMFWPGPQYTYGPYDDVYGGYAYGGPARTRVPPVASPLKRLAP